MVSHKRYPQMSSISERGHYRFFFHRPPRNCKCCHVFNKTSSCFLLKISFLGVQVCLCSVQENIQLFKKQFVRAAWIGLQLGRQHS